MLLLLLYAIGKPFQVEAHLQFFNRCFIILFSFISHSFRNVFFFVSLKFTSTPSLGHMCLVLSRLIIHQNTVSSSIHSSIANERRNKSKGFSSSYHHFNVSTPSSSHIFSPFALLVHRTSSQKNIRREFNLIKRRAIIIDFPILFRILPHIVTN